MNPPQQVCSLKPTETVGSQEGAGSGTGTRAEGGDSDPTGQGALKEGNLKFSLHARPPAPPAGFPVATGGPSVSPTGEAKSPV